MFNNMFNNILYEIHFETKDTLESCNISVLRSVGKKVVSYL